MDIKFTATNFHYQKQFAFIPTCSNKDLHEKFYLFIRVLLEEVKIAQRSSYRATQLALGECKVITTPVRPEN